jgi:hypothetical protein
MFALLGHDTLRAELAGAKIAAPSPSRCSLYWIPGMASARSSASRPLRSSSVRGLQSVPSSSSRSKAERITSASWARLWSLSKIAKPFPVASYGFPVDHRLSRPEGCDGLTDAGIALGLIEGATREQTYPAIALAGDYPVALVLDFVNPQRPDRRF